MTKEHSPSPSRIQDGSFYNAALTIVGQVLNRRINRKAQESLARDIVCVAIRLRSASLVDQLFLTSNDIARIQSFFHHSQRFRHLDLLSIGDDHVFVVHRALLMQDIQDYLSGSNKYLLRVFVNVDYRLSKPAMIPDNRCIPLEDYIANVLRPEIELRIQTWDDAERRRPPLPAPRNVSLVTLTGWMLTYPIIYVIPKTSRRASTKAYHYEDVGHSEEVDDDVDEGEEEDNDLLGRNCLANQPLVVTRVTLEPNCEIIGLQEHAFMSFSFPADLDPPPNVECDDGYHRASRPPSQDFSQQQTRTNSGGRHPSRTNSTSTQDSVYSSSSSIESATSPLTITSADCERFYPDDDVIESAVLSPRLSDGSDGGAKKQQPSAKTPNVSAEVSPTTNKTRLASTDSDRVVQQAGRENECEQVDEDVEQEVCVFAAGRSFLHQLHVRFQQQKLWTNWQVGQETVTLPVVAM
ncbi:hypothetical protein BGZ73_004354 [Actinomortierella ambigua]|nr:hypothetical protein BGZ73_004354 [Actinomortierella ambigua]